MRVRAAHFYDLRSTILKLAIVETRSCSPSRHAGGIKSGLCSFHLLALMISESSDHEAGVEGIFEKLANRFWVGTGVEKWWIHKNNNRWFTMCTRFWSLTVINTFQFDFFSSSELDNRITEAETCPTGNNNKDNFSQTWVKKTQTYDLCSTFHAQWHLELIFLVQSMFSFHLLQSKKLNTFAQIVFSRGQENSTLSRVC